MATDPMWCFEHYGEAAEYIDELEAENAELNNEVVKLKEELKVSRKWKETYELGLEATKLELAAAQLDAARLDWIQRNARADPKMDGQHVWWPTSFDKTIKGPTIREAVDSAMKGEQP